VCETSLVTKMYSYMLGVGMIMRVNVIVCYQTCVE
jgi:hypothetical protein